MKALLVADGSGGHLIPALQVADRLAGLGVRAKVWYAERRTIAPLSGALTREAMNGHPLDVDPIPIDASPSLLRRLWRCGQLWHRAERCFDTFAPDVVVGFGGWVSAPVILAAKRRRIGCVLHEQNVVMGRANQWLARWADRVAVSFEETQDTLVGLPSIMTGLPVRDRIGRLQRSEGAQHFGLDSDRPTLLILGGSQGARAINRLMMALAALVSAEERRTWQVIHVAGPDDEEAIQSAYAAQQVTARVLPFLVEMEAAYAQADVVIGRAGASTIAELARCGTPALLIPYPHAGGHQRANAQLVEVIGGGVMLEELEATPARVLGSVRRILRDHRLRAMMGAEMHQLHRADSAERLTTAVLDVARARDGTSSRPDAPRRPTHRVAQPGYGLR